MLSPEVGKVRTYEPAILLVPLHKVPPPKESMKESVENRGLNMRIPVTARLSMSH
jgi:hypothetical protein